MTWSTLTKNELIELLDPYDGDTNIGFGVHLQQGYVGFFDIVEDIDSNREEFILTSKSLDEWYRDDIQELQEEILQGQELL